MKSTVSLRVGLVFCGFCGVAVYAQTQPQRQKISEIRGYTSWVAVNAQPAPMDADVAILCAPPPSVPKLKPVKGTQGPHAKKWINVFVNSVGASAMLSQKRPRFPVGTVIVKQKLASPTNTKPELLTVMIKRPPHYDRKNGDWEYMVTDGAGEKEAQRGPLKSCQGCHSAWKTTDFVSRAYLPSAVLQALKESNDAMTKPK